MVKLASDKIIVVTVFSPNPAFCPSGPDFLFERGQISKFRVMRGPAGLSNGPFGLFMIHLGYDRREAQLGTRNLDFSYAGGASGLMI